MSHTATHEKIEFIWFDEVGVGAGAIDDFARLKNPGWQYYMPKAHNGASKPNGYDARFSMAQTNGQFFRNLKAQAWWHLRLRLENTLKLMDGQNIPLAKCLFISDEIERKYGKAHLERLILELGQASYKHEDGKLIVDKQPDNKSSPNQADAVIISFDSDMHNGLGYLL